MKICIAQTHSVKGKISQNIQDHLSIIERAITIKADLIVFPELSITNYEPKLAKALATNIENDMFTPFQTVSNQNNITIDVGMPTNVNDGVQISMLIFKPHEKRSVYSKQILHNDKIPYFVCENNKPY